MNNTIATVRSKYMSDFESIGMSYRLVLDRRRAGLRGTILAALGLG